MGFINVIIKHDGAVITNSTISYNRDHQICSGIGTLELLVPLNIGRTFKPWDVIEIWESGDKKGKFFIDSVSKAAKEGAIQIKATDGSKRLSDYFITDTYTIDYLSYGRTWIEKFLTEAGVTYSFTVSGNGSPLSNNTSLGYDSAFTTITTLLQQSGWYLYFNNDGTAIIGDLHKDVSNPDHSIDASDFSELLRELDDDRLRNRAVVWGNSNPTFGEVFVDISVQTPWNYDAQDKRAVVLSNSSIYNNAQARSLAIMMLNEFTQIKDEKTLLVLNDYNFQIGEILKINSKYWSGRGLITGITASFSKDGLTYQVTINQKCPRLFTFFSTLPPTVSGFYVYIGTAGDGIWRKYTADSAWYNDSSGLEDLEINDLFIRNGTFASVANDGYLYTKTSELGAWNKYSHPNLRDINGVTYSNMDLRAVACSINMSDNIIAGYNFVPVSGIVASGIVPSGMSWVLELTGGQSLIRAEQIVISGSAGDGYDFGIFDLESTGEYNIVSISGFVPVSGWVASTVDHYNKYGSGHRDICLFRDGWAVDRLPPDTDSLAIGWGYGDQTYSDKITGTQVTYPSSLICDETTQNYWYVGWSAQLVKIDPTAKTSTTWSFTKPAEWSIGSPSIDFGIALRHKDTNTFDFVVLIQSAGPVYTLYHYTYTLGDGALTSAGNSGSFGSNAGIVGFGLIGNTAIVHYAYANTAHAKLLNLTTGSFSDVDIFTGMGAGYQGLSGASVLFSTGDSLIAAYIYLAGTDLFEYPNCPIGPSTEARKVELWAKGYRITKYGSQGIIGPVLLQTFDKPSGTDRFDFPSTRILPVGVRSDYVATNTLLNRAYLILPIGFRASDCTGPSNYNIAGLTVGISFPNLSIFYSKWSDSGTWWGTSDEYIPTNGSELVGKVGGALNASEYGSFDSQYGKYATPGFIVWSAESGAEYSEFRSAPAYGTSYGHSSSLALNFGSKHPKDDLTNQLIWGTSDVSTPHYMYLSQQWNLQDSDSKMNIDSFGYTGISQHYGVSHGYKIYLFGDTELDDYPLGSILKHTSTTELGTKITAVEDSLEQTLGIFEIIKTTQVPCKVDIANGTPTVIYNIPPEDGLNSQEFWGSVQNEVDSFYTHSDPKPIYEARTFNLISPSTFPTVSGELTAIDYERYIGITNREGILASEYYLDTPWVNLVTVYSGVAISGLITHFETSNFVPEGTYFFYTVSGVKSFFQKNPEENYWRDYSTGLPDSAISIIRCDDLI